MMLLLSFTRQNDTEPAGTLSMKIFTFRPARLKPQGSRGPGERDRGLFLDAKDPRSAKH
jgi:hypothetical protein